MALIAGFDSGAFSYDEIGAYYIMIERVLTKDFATFD